jgi:multidrug efflux pump subunit AcrB
MDLTTTALERNRVTAVALFVLLALGLATYRDMPRAEDPGFIVRTAVVTTQFPGASPERVELLVTDKLEKVIQEIPELDYINSTSKVGLSFIYVNIREEYRDMRPLWDDLRRKVESAVGDLPDGVIGPVVDDEFGDVFGFIVGLTGPDFSFRELNDIAEAVRDELLLIPEAAKVEIAGAQDERIFVEYDNARLAGLGVSPVQLKLALEARNIVQPGGEVRSRFETIVFEPTGSFESLDDLGQTFITVSGTNALIRLRDIATIRRGYVEPPTSLMRMNGERALAISVSMREGANNITLGREITRVINRAREVYPIGIDFELLQNQADIVQKKIDDFESNLLGAIAIVVIVMLVFLGLRTGLIVASLIPFAIIASFPLMSLFGIGLDQMSLASLIIALGMLVDNAIVMSESIMVRMQSGATPRDAAESASRELRGPLLISSLTTAAAFLPIFLAESSTGEYTAPLFKVVTITLLCSWVLALTVVPLMCESLLRVRQLREDEKYRSPFYKLYRDALVAVVRHPHIGLGVTLAVLGLAVAGMGLVPNIFFPANDRPTFTLALDLPEGTPLARTNEVTAGVEAHMLNTLMATGEREGITNWASFIGQGAPRFNLGYAPQPSNPNYAIAIVNASDDKVMVDSLIPNLQQMIRARYPDVDATIRPLELGAPAWPPVAVRISGRDDDTLFDIVDHVKTQLRATPGTLQISDDWGPRTKKAVIRIDENRARLAGVTHQDIATSMQSYFTGITATDFREDEDLIPIVLRSLAGNREPSQGLGSANVYAQATGQSVPFEQVASVELVFQPGVIERRNRLRTVTVESLLQAGYTAKDVTGALQPWMEAEAAGWPFGYTWEFGGEVETSGKADQSIGEKLPVGALIIVLLLVIQFNSIRLPLIILVTIPLSLIGVTFGLVVAQSYFGFMTLLGIISLAGIVINNAIVLLDAIRINIDELGMAPGDAIVAAGQQRLRPILLTTATTVGGMLPLWLGGGPMWEPMAVAIIFGLLFSTILTLFVVPMLYTILFRVDFRARQQAPGSPA